jgi:hypothetical protein
MDFILIHNKFDIKDVNLIIKTFIKMDLYFWCTLNALLGKTDFNIGNFFYLNYIGHVSLNVDKDLYVSFGPLDKKYIYDSESKLKKNLSEDILEQGREADIHLKLFYPYKNKIKETFNDIKDRKYNFFTFNCCNFVIEVIFFNTKLLESGYNVKLMPIREYNLFPVYPKNLFNFVIENFDKDFYKIIKNDSKKSNIIEKINNNCLIL